jgi:hypothetical protein
LQKYNFLRFKKHLADFSRFLIKFLTFALTKPIKQKTLWKQKTRFSIQH